MPSLDQGIHLEYIIRWTWLVEKEGKVSILKTSNADNPITDGYRPLITLDVWEHAYYLDYQNRRVDYAQIFLDNLVNWDYANENLGRPHGNL